MGLQVKALLTEGHKEILHSESDACYKLNTYLTARNWQIGCYIVEYEQKDYPQLYMEIFSGEDG